MRKTKTGAVLTAGLTFMLIFASISRAELSIEDTRKLLQESLTISEIDREIERLGAEEDRVSLLISNAELDIEKQSEKVDKARTHAGKVLRAYYTGDRDRVWLLLLQASNFNDALTVYQYLQLIADADKRTMNRFLATYRELKQLREQLVVRQGELADLKQAFITQRERVLGLQRELDAKLGVLDNKNELLDQMAKLTASWRQDGLPVFRDYLQAMSDAMLHLQEYLTDNDDALEQKNRRTVLFRIKEQPLNDFLRKQNPLFEKFVFDLTESRIIIRGNKGNVNIVVGGHYAIEQEPEEALRFMLDELTYNDFKLPDTTRAEMQQQFSMAFYPKDNALTAMLEVTDVQLKDGELAIELTLR